MPEAKITTGGSPRRPPAAGRLRAWRARAGDSDGFTLIETIVATVVLVIGLLGAFVLLDTASQTSAATRAREGAVSLAREISEDSRSIPFSQLSPYSLVSQLQAMPGLANAGSGSTWQIVRRGFTYTVTANECSVDDGKDGYGTHDSTFCADSNQTGTTDPNPVDLKRVTVNVSWNALHQNHSVQEVATLTSAGEAAGLVTSGLQVASPSSLVGSVAPTISSTSITGLSFKVTAPSGTTAIVWTLDGDNQTCGFNNGSSCWTSTQSGTSWTSSTWTISGLSDGTYQIGAAAEDANGIIGPAQTIPVTLVRNIPAAPNVDQYGFNANLYSGGSKTANPVAELWWQPNTERNVAGYRIYNPSGTLICTTTNATSYTSCGSNAWCTTPSACIDLSPPLPTASNLTYQVAATYYDANGVLQEGPRTSVTLNGISGDIFTLANSTQNNGSTCSGTGSKDMLGTYTGGSTDSTQTGGTLTFCSDPFSSGDEVQGGGTASAYLSNSSSSTACTVTSTLSTDGNSSGAVTSTVSVPKSTTTPAKFTFNFTNNNLLTMNTGDELNLKFDMSATGCSSTTLHYGSTSYPGSFTTAQIPLQSPTTPASLTVTAQPGGTAQLSWPEPTTGAPVSFFRIYRDGHNYGNRYDFVPESDCNFGTCYYTDGKRGGTTHSYYVTAVGGTTPGGDMAESPAVGPVTN